MFPLCKFLFPGNDVVLPCQTVGNPKPKLIWLDIYKRQISDNDKLTILRDGALRIRSLSWEDMGEYTCISSNSMGEDQVVTFLYPMKVGFN